MLSLSDPLCIFSQASNAASANDGVAITLFVISLTATDLWMNKLMSPISDDSFFFSVSLSLRGWNYGVRLL